MSDIHIPNSRGHEFTVEVSANSLRIVRVGLSQIANTVFQASELFLALATFAAGGVLAAVQSGVSPKSNELWWLFYCILPAVACGGLVTYFLFKGISNSIPAAKAKDLLSVLPDPDQTIPLYEEMNRLTGVWNLESTTCTSGKKSNGTINFSVKRGRISAGGILYGESDAPIANISTEMCDYQQPTKQLLLVYRLSSHNDDGSQQFGLCILHGTVFFNEQSDGTIIKGRWFQLQGSSSVAPPWGNTILTLCKTRNSLK